MKKKKSFFCVQLYAVYTVYIIKINPTHILYTTLFDIQPSTLSQHLKAILSKLMSLLRIVFLVVCDLYM